MKLHRLLTMTALLTALGAPVFSASLESGKNKATETDVTVITADRLTFDYKNHFALFEQNVVVTDPEMQLTSDKLTVQFDEKGAAQVIKADGQVHIIQMDKSAYSQVATYDVKVGKIVLAGNPRVVRGRDTLEGEVITFWRDENKMVCQSKARLVIHSEKGGSREKLFGE